MPVQVEILVNKVTLYKMEIGRLDKLRRGQENGEYDYLVAYTTSKSTNKVIHEFISHKRADGLLKLVSRALASVRRMPQ